MLAHYGVTDLERTPSLEEAVFRIFLAQQRTAPDVAMVDLAAAALAGRAGRRRRGREPPRASCSTAWSCATQLRFPVVGDLARSVRFRWFDQPLVTPTAPRCCGSVGDELDQLDALPDGPDRAARIDALAAIPERIVRFLGERLRPGRAATASRCSRC